DRNRAAWNRLADNRSRFAKVATDAEVRHPLQTLDSRGWLPTSVAGMDVLCLASGGGWQSILYASAGANVTVVDLSPSMLALDRREADRRGLSVQIVEASMDDLSAFDQSAFDIVHQPVSTCYVPAIETVYREIARVLRDGGLYISQHKQPASLQITHRNNRDRFVIGVEYYREGPLPQTDDTSYREPGATEYLHRTEQIVGGLCRAGFVIEDLSEPYRADPKAAVTEFGYRGRFTPPYIRMKARRRARSDSPTNKPALWTP
ncbi:MAG: class I SAM-dependent methyltransferase, partial [Planctomycetaceae bacterium]